MGDDPSVGSVGRRSFLAGAAGAATLAAVPALGAANDPFSPRTSYPIDGAKEAVIGESGEVAYIATTDGFATVDVSDPSSPSTMASVTGIKSDRQSGPLSGIYDLDVDGDTLVVGGPAQGAYGLTGFAVYDVADPASPELQSFYDTSYGIHNLFVAGDYAYLTANGLLGKPVEIVDISADEPTDVAEFTPEVYDMYPGTIHDIYVAGDTLYACYWDLGTWVVDVSDPTAPDGLLRVGYDLETETTTSTNELPGNSHYAQPHPERPILAVGKEAFEDPETETSGAPGGIELWDLSDMSSPSREYIIKPPAEFEGSPMMGTAHNFGWRGDRLYASWYAGGVAVYEVADAGSPMLLDRWQDVDRASFWTAKPAAEGFVATSLGGQAADASAGLFTFPEPAGGGEPAPRMEPMAPAAYDTDLEEPTPTPSPTPTDTPTATPTPTEATTPTDGRTRTATAAGDTETATSSPGLGALSALVAGGLAGWRLWRRREE